MVVSNLDLNINDRMMRSSEFLKSSIKEDLIINVSHDYRYMKMGYYVSLHAEVLGDPVVPSTENILDAYRTPIMLLKAGNTGIPTLPYLVAGSVKQIMSELSFPVVLFPVNPISSDAYRVAGNRTALYKAFKSLSMNYRYAVCALPFHGEIISCKIFFGKSSLNDAAAEEIAAKVYERFRIPICNLLIQKIGGKPYLCSLQPVKRDDLSLQDLKLISQEISKLRREPADG